MKYFLIAFLLFSTSIFSQKNILDCKHEFSNLETISISKTDVLYKIISVKKGEIKGNSNYNKGVLLLNLKKQFNLKEITKAVAEIGIRNEINEFLVFNSCEAINLFFQSTKLTEKQEQYLNENYIGDIKLDFEKSKNKKVSKKEKRKLKMMQDIANQTCNELTQTEKINAEIFKNSLIKIMIKNHEKINKYYATLSEEGLEKFTMDLTKTLTEKCDVFKEFMKTQ